MRVVVSLFYNNKFNVDVLFANNQIIDIQAIIKRKNVFISFVCRDSVPKFCDQVWERLIRTGRSLSDPWFIIRDLNELTGNHETQGGNLRHASTFMSFSLMIQNYGMIKFPYLGNNLSWTGGETQKLSDVVWPTRTDTRSLQILLLNIWL